MVILSEKGAYMESKFWLMKSEPTDYSFDDLKSETDSTAEWDGVRNYQARNLLRDNIKSGDRVIFYHSNSKPPGAVGTAVVVRDGYPDLRHGTSILTILIHEAQKKAQYGTWWI